MGGNSDEIFLRLSHWFSKNLQAALDLDQERHGLYRLPSNFKKIQVDDKNIGHEKVDQTIQVRERYVEPSVFLFRPWNLPLSAMLAYRFMWTTNAGFERGKNETNHIVRFDFNYQF